MPQPRDQPTRWTTATAGRFVLQAAIWGSSFALIQVALRDMSASALVLSRLVPAAIALGVAARVQGTALVTGVHAWAHVGVAAVLANVLPYLLLSYGEGHTSAGVAGVLVGGTPLLTVLAVAVVLPAERLRRREVAGYLLGFAGVVLVLGPWNAGLGSPWARVACFGAAASYAAGYVYVRLFLSGARSGPRAGHDAEAGARTEAGFSGGSADTSSARAEPLGLAASQLIAAAAIQALLTPLLPWRAPHPHWSGVLSVLVLGVLGTGYATILYFRLIADVGPGAAAAVDYLVPVFAVAFGVTLLSEPLTWNLVAGGLTVLAGVAVVQSRARSPRRGHGSRRHQVEKPGEQELNRIG